MNGTSTVIWFSAVVSIVGAGHGRYALSIACILRDRLHNLQIVHGAFEFFSRPLVTVPHSEDNSD